MKKKFFSILLAVLMLASLVPTGLFTTRASADSVGDKVVLIPTNGEKFEETVAMDPGSGSIVVTTNTADCIDASKTSVTDSGVVTITSADGNKPGENAVVTLTYKEGGANKTRVYNVTVRSFTKTVEWIKAGDTAQIIINCTQKKMDGDKVPRVLFLGSLCKNHDLGGATVAAALNAIKEIAEVDYFLGGFKYNVSSSSTPEQKVGHLNSSSPTVTDTQFTPGDGYHISHFLFAQVLTHPENYFTDTVCGGTGKGVSSLSDYDMIVLEFDGTRMGYVSNTLDAGRCKKLGGSDYYDSYSKLQELLTDAAVALKPFYDNQSVVWLIPQLVTGSSVTTNGGTYLFDDKGITGGSGNSRIYSYDTLALIAPEDWLEPDGAGGYRRKTPSFEKTPAQAFSFADNKSLFKAPGETAVSSAYVYRTRTNMQYQNGAHPNGMWEYYDNASQAGTMIKTKTDEATRFKEVDISDMVAAGFVITKIYGEYKTTGDWTRLPEGDSKFSYKRYDKPVSAGGVESADGRYIEAAFDLKALKTEKVRMVIEIRATADVEYSGSSGGKSTATTNDGDAEADYPLDPVPTPPPAEPPALEEPPIKVTKAVTEPASSGTLYLAAGDVATYEVKIDAIGTDNLYDIHVTDTMLGISDKLISALTKAVPGATEGYFGATLYNSDDTVNTADFTGDDIEHGQYVVLTFKRTVTQADIIDGKVTNIASAYGYTDPAVQTDDTYAGDEGKVETEAAKLSVVKTAVLYKNDGTTPKGTGEKAEKGDKIKYTITVTNIGKETLTGVTVTDAKLVLNDLPIWAGETNEGKLVPGEVWTYVGWLEVKSTDIVPDSGNLKVINEASATGKFERNGVEISVSDSDTVKTDATKPNVAIAVDKTHDGSNGADRGEMVNYKITIKNEGTESVTNIVITDAKAIPTAPHEKLVLDSGEAPLVLAPGASVDVYLDYTVTEADIIAGTIVNTASVTCEMFGDPTVTVTESDSDTYTPASPAPALSVEKTMDHFVHGGVSYSTGYPDLHDEVYYKITVTNIGNVTVNNIQVEDVLTGDTGASALMIPTLAPGASASVVTAGSYTVTEADIHAGSKKNVATAEGTGAAGGDTPTAQVDYDTYFHQENPSMVITKEDDVTDGVKAEIDQIITYTVTVGNNGNVTLTNIEVKDSLTPAAVLTSGSETIASLEPGGTATLKYTYKVTAADLVAGKVINSAIIDSVDGTPVINDDSATEETPTNMPLITISGSKTWDDHENQDGVRPADITVRLFADGTEVDSTTVTSAGGWTYSFDDKPMYSMTGPISYTVKEDDVPFYTATYSGTNITNSHTPGVVVVNGRKTWDDGGDADGIRPDAIVIHLFADGVMISTKTVTAEDDWKWSFPGLDACFGGLPIYYTITEEPVDGYESTVSGFNVTNKHLSEKINVSGAKTWNDEDDKDGKRPESITVRLLADGTEVASKIVTAADGWSWTFEGLPKLADGKEIVYTVTEDPVEGYSAEISGYNIANTLDAEADKKDDEEEKNDDGEEGGTGGDGEIPTYKPPMPTEPPEDATFWMDDPDLPMGYWEWDDEEEEWVWVETDYLPQTGTDFWPVPVLAFAGLVLIGMGSVIRTRNPRKKGAHEA